MTVGSAYEHLSRALRVVYDPREAASVAGLVLESRLGLGRLDRVLRKGELLSPEQEIRLEEDLSDLLRNRPVQYVLGEAWFDGLLLRVDEHVLIPRPETEELVHWVAEDAGAASGSPGGRPLCLLDIGTGSGCIAIALKKRLPSAEVHALDVSASALALAKTNAERCGTEIHFHQADFLDESIWPTLPRVDVLVSNPPYIAESEKGSMHPRVLEQEPHLALFVPDRDPLLFYRKIAWFLRPGMTAYMEVNEALGRDTVALFGAEAALRKDMQGKDRMIRAAR